jgi:mannose-6-phosphate isomerase-like protein (cupin superfamily)
MNPSLTTLTPPAPAADSKYILSQDGFKCSLLTLAPGDEAARVEGPHVEEQILFVLEGQATVGMEDLNTLLKKDEAMLIPKGREHSITAHPTGWARLLRVEVPPRQVITPQILSFDS